MGIHTPPTVALLFTVAFIVFLFRRDFREKPNVSGALWLPLVWMLLTCSRAISGWLDIFGLPVGGVPMEGGGLRLEEGSPLDACAYFALIIAGFCILNKRQASLSEIVRHNGWLIVFLVYCFISIAWSDFPLVAFKRWIKILGHPIMVLILLTEADPEEAVTRLMKRCAYVVLPVSILFIKYYPEWGRSFDIWTGTPANNGIAEGKNMLGADCLILGYFFIWHLLQIWRTERGTVRRNELLLTGGLLLMIWWLFSMAHSSTSLGSLLIGVITLLFVGMRSVNKNFVGTYIVVAIVLFAAAETTFGISEYFLQALNRDPTLTGRTELWRHVLDFHTNPIFGVGFESFWLGDRLKKMGEIYWWIGNQAHNGYLETYLNLGLLGLFVLIAWIIASFRKIRLELLENFEFGRFRLGFLVAVVLYNWTEASFKTLHPVWFAFFIIAMDYPKPQFAPVEESSLIINPEEETELAYFPDGIQSR
jgi:exopolysaccharide production protein ExoQ